jgi:hypothetical protein
VVEQRSDARLGTVPGLSEVRRVTHGDTSLWMLRAAA